MYRESATYYDEKDKRKVLGEANPSDLSKYIKQTHLKYISEKPVQQTYSIVLSAILSMSSLELI